MPQLSYKIIQSTLKYFYFEFQSLLDCEITFLLYQNHTTAHVLNSRCIHYQKSDRMLSFSILQMNQRTSDNFQLLL